MDWSEVREIFQLQGQDFILCILKVHLISLILFVQTEGLFHTFIKPECLEIGMQAFIVQEDLKRELGGVMGLPWWLRWLRIPCNAGDPGSIPALRKASGKGNDYQLQYSCLENYMDRGVWQETVCGVTKSWTGLSD